MPAATRARSATSPSWFGPAPGVLAPPSPYPSARHAAPTVGEQTPPGRRRWWVLALKLVPIPFILLLTWPATLGGFFGLTVVSGKSMTPTYITGQFVLTARDAPYTVGDVIVYLPDGMRTYVVHRITEVEPDGRFVTQGDGNKVADPWTVDPDSVIGKVAAAGPRCTSVWCSGTVLMRLLPAVLVGVGASWFAFVMLVRLVAPGLGAHRADGGGNTPEVTRAAGSPAKPRRGRPRHGN
jgi:signal peptidase I